MAKTWTMRFLALSLAASPALAEEAKAAPRPGPEHQRLGFFVGRWKTEGTMHANPFMPGGKVTSSDTCEWFEGRYAVVCRGSGKGPAGPTRSLGLMGYSAEEKAYVYYAVDNGPMAMATVPKGKVEGSVWTYADESRMGEQLVKSRYVITELDPRSYAFKWEIQGADGAWSTVVEGKSRRVK